MCVLGRIIVVKKNCGIGMKWFDGKKNLLWYGIELMKFRNIIDILNKNYGKIISLFSMFYKNKFVFLKCFN